MKEEKSMKPSLRRMHGLAGFDRLATIGLIASFLIVRPATARERSDEIVITTLSGQPDRGSGGSALVGITFPPHERHLVVTLNGEYVSSGFYPGDRRNSLVGLVTRLVLG